MQVTNADTSLTRTLVTDANGRYTAPDLPPGPYEVKATLPGFSTVVRSGIRLTVGRDAVVDLTLKLGQISDQITVIGILDRAIAYFTFPNSHAHSFPRHI